MFRMSRILGTRDVSHRTVTVSDGERLGRVATDLDPALYAKRTAGTPLDHLLDSISIYLRSMMHDAIK